MPTAARVRGMRTVLFYGVVFVLGWLVFLVFEPFLIPLGWAAVFAVLFYPWCQRLKRRWGPRSTAAAGTVGVTLMLILPSLLLMFLFVREGVQAASELQSALAAGKFDWVNREWSWVAHRFGGNGPNLPDLLQQGAERVGSFLAAELGTILRNVALFLLDLFITLFALFFFFRDGDAIVAAIRRVLPFEDGTNDQILNEARELINASVATSLVIAAFQGLVDGAAFAAVGIHAAVFWGIVMAFFSLLPIVGSWPIWVPTAIWLLVTGHFMSGIVLFAICGGLVAAAENFIRPALISGRTSLNELLVFISVLGGIAAFGMLGIVLGPIVVATAMSILDVYSRRESPA